MATPSATKTRRKTTFNSNHTPKTLTPKSHGPNSASISSSFFKSVYLEDWWLVKAQGKGLAVGGFSHNEMQGIRLFCSEAIATRHDTTTLETTDGFTISISGFINRSRTRANGFPSEVCNRFLLGFPYDWEDYAAQCFCEKSSEGCVPNRVSAFDEFSKSFGENGDTFIPDSLDDIPVTRTRDLLMSTLDDSGNSAVTKSIFDDILRKLGGKPFNNTGESIHSKADGGDSTMDFAQDGTPSNPKKAKVNKKSKDSSRCFDEKFSDGCVPNRVSAFDEFSKSSGKKGGDSTVDFAQDDTPSNPKKAKVNNKSKDSSRCFDDKFSDGCVPNRVSAFDEFSKSSGEKGDSVLLDILDGVPATRARDLLMSTLGDSGNSAVTESIFDDIPGKLGGKPFNIIGESTSSKADGNDSKEDFAQDDTPSNHKKAKVHNKMKDRNVILNATNMRTKKYNNGTSQSKMGMDVLTVNCGVATRSMAKRMSSQNNQEENSSLISSAKKGISDLSFSSEAAGQQQGRVTRSSSNTSRATNPIKEKKEARKVLDKSAQKIKC